MQRWVYAPELRRLEPHQRPAAGVQQGRPIVPDNKRGGVLPHHSIHGRQRPSEGSVGEAGGVLSTVAMGLRAVAADLVRMW